MIVGIGNDLVNFKRIEKTVLRFGDKFLNKVFAEEELFLAKQRTGDGFYKRLAGCWAGKEALIKAFSGMPGVSLKDIVITRLLSGAPCITLKKKASSYAEGKKIYFSLADEDTYVQAMVVIAYD